MTESIVIYHNPRCSKSRAALALLRDRGVEPEVVEYLKTPLDADAVRGLLGALGMSARDLLRGGEAPYRELGLSDPGRSEDDLVAAMKGLPRVEGVDELFVPGEPEERVYRDRIENGIPLPPGTRDKLNEVAVKFALQVPWEA